MIGGVLTRLMTGLIDILFILALIFLIRSTSVVFILETLCKTREFSLLSLYEKISFVEIRHNFNILYEFTSFCVKPIRIVDFVHICGSLCWFVCFVFLFFLVYDIEDLLKLPIFILFIIMHIFILCIVPIVCIAKFL